MQYVPTPGDVVRVRGRRWTVARVTAHEDCAALDLIPATASDSWSGHAPYRAEQTGVTLLVPFDRPVRVPPRPAPLIVSRRAWMAACRTAVCRAGDRAFLRAAARADLVLLPYQLEAAIETVAHKAPRLLLADAVGLGKTIQAGLVLAELVRRHALERALVLTPPGLREQWAAELLERFGLAATIADAAWVRAMRAEWPASLNPWSVPGVFIASIDFVKRPEVGRSLDDVSWDLVIVDEAHAACGESDRREIAHRCASRARRVLLLTATPHAGDDAAFDSLTRIGALAEDDAIAIFRRSRADVGLPSRRRVRLLRVRGTAAEASVHRALRDYVRAVWTRAGEAARDAARLAMVVLLKRSLSGMAPLVRSLEARRDALAGSPPASEHQLALPWDDDLDEADRVPAAVLGAPGLDDVESEREWLAALIGLAGHAVATDSKLRVLRRLLGRIREPVIVFTEYRDTLAAVAAALGPAGQTAVLHGGLDSAERRDVVARFTRGHVHVLIATDAAGAGLNLQARCRIVVNLELPWNPMRLEQRVGRVDRIGQARTVHAVNLIARATAETTVLARLARRLARADAAVGSIGDVLGRSDEAIAERWAGVRDRRHEPRGIAGVRATRLPRRRNVIVRPDRRAEADALVVELRNHRALWAPGHDRTFRASIRSTEAAVVVCAVSRRRLRGPLADGGVLALVNAGGGLLPVLIRLRVPRLRGRPAVRAAAEGFLHTCGPIVLERARLRSTEAARRERPDAGQERGGLALRDQRLARAAQAASCLHQPGLFDRRAECALAAGQHPRRCLKPAPTGASDIEMAGARDPVPHASTAESSIALLLFITDEGGCA